MSLLCVIAFKKEFKSRLSSRLWIVDSPMWSKGHRQNFIWRGFIFGVLNNLLLFVFFCFCLSFHCVFFDGIHFCDFTTWSWCYDGAPWISSQANGERLRRREKRTFFFLFFFRIDLHSSLLVWQLFALLLGILIYDRNCTLLITFLSVIISNYN